MASNTIQAVKGMNDLLPDQTGLWHAVECLLSSVAESFGYQELRTPIVEKTELFQQSIGDQTDIVEKEMYTFDDLKDQSLTLRPEATASCVRACLQHGLLHNQQQRIWYMGPMFTRAKPQKERYRQFYQFGVEAYGWADPEMDLEILQIGHRILKSLAIDDVILQLNTLGSEQCRVSYRTALQKYLINHQDSLDADSQRRLATNPLRILDSKNRTTQAILVDAPSISDYLDATEKSHFERLLDLLQIAGIETRVEPRLVRGLDYYTSTVFEWVTTDLGSQGTVCGGGRYDDLVEQRGGRATPAVGFALGMERLIALMQQRRLTKDSQLAGVYMINLSDQAAEYSISQAEILRDQGLRVTNHCGGGKLKSQLKRADKSRSRWACILGENEFARNVAQVKDLGDGSQSEVGLDNLVEWFAAQA